MTPAELVGVAAALVLSLVAGTVAHELSHAAVLRAVGVPHAVRWLPDRSGGDTLRASLGGRLAAVTPREFPVGTSPWAVRAAALMPLALAAPVVLVLLGLLPDPVGTGDPVLAALTVGWLACAIPSPQDFALCWYASRLVPDSGSS